MRKTYSLLPIFFQTTWTSREESNFYWLESPRT